LALTPNFANHNISPESSDGFASVGTILPKDEATPVAGWPCRFLRTTFVGLCVKKFPEVEDDRKKFVSTVDPISEIADAGTCGEVRSAPMKEARHVSCSAYCVTGVDRSFDSGDIDMAHDLCR
jgi:hypothetical protein